MQKNITSQQFVVFAFDATTNLPKTGDAANITATISKDFAADVATNDVNPTETQKGFYVFDALQAETNADSIQIFPSSVTSNIQVISVPGLITTVPVDFGDDVIQSADNDTKLTTIAADVVNIDGAAMRGTDGVDTATMRGTDGANTVVPPSVAQFNARTLLSADYFDFTSDEVQVGTNNDKTGYSISGTKQTLDALNDILATDIVTSGAIQTGSGIVINVGQVGQLLAIANDVITAASIAAGALDDKGNWNIGKTGYSLTQSFPTNFADMAITVTTGKLTIGTNDDKTGYSISGTKQTLDALNDITAANVLTAGDIDGFSLEDSLKLISSATFGVVSGAATTTMVFTAVDGSKTRITATVDAVGNRSVIISDATG